MPASHLQSELHQVFEQQSRAVRAETVSRVTSQNYRPRAVHRRRTRRLTVGAVLAGATAAVLLAAPMPWDHGAGLSSSAYAVTPHHDGSIEVETTWSKLHDPAGLQATLDRAHARTRIYVTGDAPDDSVPACNNYVQRSAQTPAGAVTGIGAADDGHLDVTVHPALFPSDATMVVVVDYLSPADGDAATMTYLAIRPLPNCAPTSWNGPDGGGGIGH